MFKDYNMNQLVLPLDLEIKLQQNDIAYHVHQLVGSIPQEPLEPFIQHEGCPAYHPRMMWLAQGYEPSYRTINRFRVQPQVKELIRECFVQFRCQLVQEKLLIMKPFLLMGRRLKPMPISFRLSGSHRTLSC